MPYAQVQTEDANRQKASYLDDEESEAGSYGYDTSNAERSLGAL